MNYNFAYTVEDLLLHDLYVLAAFAEQESSSERLKQVSFYRNFFVNDYISQCFFFLGGGCLEFYIAL